MVEGFAEVRWPDEVDCGDADGGLDGEGRDGGSSEDAVRGEDLEVRRDAGATGGIEPGDGEGDGGSRCGRTDDQFVLRWGGQFGVFGGNQWRFFSAG